ncbi:hypothetical protein HMPREF9372_3347 [Sporosarcina newyorkensis 2681]|uniref:DUF2634 domain-containing protein n=1 Tax=Sporosarcina newyorkensis 2681 TaxID=1027292 RepID=F9DX16_9BACL|nr:DUF2634 domain-containing protein [Sporosarcina newyorkensis]EGQ21064.1 hypothetical protein HMPREF9372_3347 [Sporosarcina newyorkensis 2681]
MSTQLYPSFDAPDLMADEVVETLQDVYAYKYDYDNERLVVTGTGKAVKGDPIDAYRFWAVKCCLTERYQYAAYSSDFGVEFQAIMEADYPRPIAESEIKRTIKEALMVDERTISVTTFSFEWSGDSCWINFKLESVYGIDNVEIQRGGELSGRIRAA